MGVVDFFSVLLPGALLTFLYKDSYIWREVFDPVLPAVQEGIQEWAAFIVASYLLGHFVFLVASYLDHSYDYVVGGANAPIRNAMRKALITTKDPKALPDQVKSMRDQHLNDAMDKDLINAFQWAKANLLLQYPAAAVEVQRYEADSKFFRSLVIVLSLVCITLVIETAWFALLACILLTALSFWGYVKRRWKGVVLAYTYYIASEKILNPEPAPGPPY